MKTFSLSRRLISAVLLVEFCSAIVLVASAGVYEALSHFRAFDVMLRGRADSMLGAVQDSEDKADNVMLDGTQTNAPRRDIYAVRDERGTILGHSANWPSPESAFESTSPFRALNMGRHRYRVIRSEGLRIVDPGDKNGGIPRHVVILYGAPTQPVWEAIGRALSFYALLSLLLLVTTGCVMLRLLRTGLQPLHDLAAQAALVSVDSWEFEPSAKTMQVRELAPLAVTLTQALKRLEQSFEQQKQFVSDAAHELKTSVAIVKSSLQVLLVRERSPKAYRAGIERAEIDCDRMEQLVATMLLLAYLESSNANSAAQAEVDLSEVLTDVGEQFRTAADLSQVRLDISSSGEVKVRGKAEELRVLCSNLLENALLHTPIGGVVRASVHVKEGRVELRVEDDGAGIPIEVLPHVFERFYRGDASRSRRTGGSGLGLAISKAIVQRCDGDIELTSELGRGTQVRVVLPLVAEASAMRSAESLHA